MRSNEINTYVRFTFFLFFLLFSMVTFSDTLRHPSCTTAPSSLANCKLITASAIGNIVNDCHHLTFEEWCSLPPSHCFSPLRPHFMCSHRWKSVLCVAWWWTMPSAHTCKKFRFLRMLDSFLNDQSSWYRNATISINLCSYLRRKSIPRTSGDSILSTSQWTLPSRFAC